MRLLLTTISLFTLTICLAQKANNLVVKGNEFYKKNDLVNAQTEYNKALKVDAKNTAALFNKGNTLYKQNQYGEAVKQYETTASGTTNTDVQAKAWYNKGVAEVKQKQMEQAAQSFKQSLKLNDNDEDTRENLQRVLNEIKKQQPPPKKQDNKQQQKPKEKPLNQQQAEQHLERLRNEEKRLQKELQQQRARPSMGEKDW